jgi:hypothetical protein
MGEVWRAVDQVLGRTVAVKVMPPQPVEQPGFAARFPVGGARRGQDQALRCGDVFAAGLIGMTAHGA